MKGTVNSTVEPSSDWKEPMLVDSAMVPMLEHRIPGLSPRTSYEVEITACNDKGWSEANQRFIFTTSRFVTTTYSSKCTRTSLILYISCLCGQGPQAEEGLRLWAFDCFMGQLPFLNGKPTVLNQSRRLDDSDDDDDNVDS